jgi:hypothetical protein
MATVSNTTGVRLPINSWDSAAPGFYYRNTEFYTKYWTIDIPDTPYNTDQDITVHLHIGKYLLHYLYKNGKSSFVIYASIANSLGVPMKEMKIDVQLFES